MVAILFVLFLLITLFLYILVRRNIDVPEKESINNEILYLIGIFGALSLLLLFWLIGLAI